MAKCCLQFDAVNCRQRTAWLTFQHRPYSLQNKVDNANCCRNMPALLPPQACELLRSMRELSGPGSCLIATCIDAELQQAHLRLPSQHYFSMDNVSWHFCMDELAAAIGQAGWRIDRQPQTAAQLVREGYGRQTYVALYGGAECCFTAVPA
jgi:hypothetical protein